MNIAIVTTEPVVDYGGLGRHTFELSKELKIMNYKLTQLITGKRVNHTKGSKVKFSIDRFFCNLRSLPNSLEKYDLFLSQGHWAGLYLWRIKRRYKKPIVVTLHSLESDRPRRREFLGFIPFFLSKVLEKLSLLTADHIFVVSNYLKERLTLNYSGYQKKATIIGNGVSNDFAGTKKQCNSKKDFLSIGIFGRLEPEKGLLEFIDELEFLVNNQIKLRCFIVGNHRPEYKGYWNEVKYKVEKSKVLKNKVIYQPFINDQFQLINSISQHDIIIMPSIYEPFGLVALEVMAIGIPIIARKVGGLQEFINNTNNGFLYENKEELLEYVQNLTQDSDLRKLIVSNARKTAKEKNWESVAWKVDEILRR